MFRFKSFVAEKKLNRGVYAEVTKRLGGARVGFELEFYVPPGSKHHDGEQDTNQSTVPLSSLRELTDFEEHFKINDRKKKQIQDAYAEWTLERENDFVDENWEDFEDSDEENDRAREQDARKQAKRAFKTPPFSKWLMLNFTSNWAFVLDFDLDPTRGWAYEDDAKSELFSDEAEDTAWETVGRSVAGELGGLLKTKVKVVNDYDYKQEYDKWKIVPDTSILDDEGKDYESFKGVGLEIVSPPLPVQDGLEALKQVSSFIDRIGATTNTSTGIHVNLSIPDLEEKLDPLKLVLFMGDEYILKKFDRLKNTYTTSQYQEIIHAIEAQGVLPKEANELVNLAKSGLHTTGKYKTVNLTKLSQGYLEFRAAGGANYHKRYDDIAEAVGRWLTAIDIACDPDKERKAYLKKITQLVGKTVQSTADDKVNTARDLDLDGLLRLLDNEWDIDFSQIKDAEDQKRAVIKMAQLLGAQFAYKPTAKQKVQARAVLRKYSLTAADLKTRTVSKSIETFIGKYLN